MKVKVVKELPGIQKAIDMLEEKGWEVTLTHQKDVSPYKAATFLEIEKGNEYFLGMALCSPNDTFSRAHGTYLAFLRLLNRIKEQFDRDEIKRYFF